MSRDPESDRIPSVVPGNGLASVIALLGSPDEANAPSFSWNRPSFSLSLRTDEKNEVEFVSVSVRPGHTAMTADGVALGRDTLTEVKQKLAAQLASAEEDFGMQDFTWYLTEELTPSPERPFKRSYSWYLNEGVPEQKALLYAQGSPGPAVFNSVAASNYSLGGK